MKRGWIAVAVVAVLVLSGAALYVRRERRVVDVVRGEVLVHHVQVAVGEHALEELADHALVGL